MFEAEERELNMGISFYAGKRINFCEACKRADYQTLFEADKRMFKESPDGPESKNGQAVYVYRGAPRLFAEHVENLKYHYGQEANDKWEAVKDCIEEKVFEKVKGLLKDGDGFMHAWW